MESLGFSSFVDGNTKLYWCPKKGLAVSQKTKQLSFPGWFSGLPMPEM